MDADSRNDIPMDEARAQLGELVLRAGYGGERLVLTRRGKPVAALIGMEDLKALNSMSAASP